MRIVQSRQVELGKCAVEAAVVHNLFEPPSLHLHVRPVKSRRPAIVVEFDAQELCELLFNLNALIVTKMVKPADADAPDEL